jgi:hypothetical protein
VALTHRGDPFSQPSGSSAFWADALAGLNLEPKGADRIAPALAPSGSVFLLNRSITARVDFGKRARPPALRPSHLGRMGVRLRRAVEGLRNATLHQTSFDRAAEASAPKARPIPAWAVGPGCWSLDILRHREAVI